MRLVLDMGDNEKIDLSKKDKGKEHDDHWRPGIANAPQNASVDLVQAGKESEPTVRSDEKGGRDRISVPISAIFKATL